ncbi:MAG TPA: ComF family protein [Terriglobia bacterium]|nr:ComF family protein [Terriglobia bacterium]
MCLLCLLWLVPVLAPGFATFSCKEEGNTFSSSVTLPFPPFLSCYTDGALAFSPTRLIDSILNLLFPVACVVCRAQVLERRWGPACPECWSRLEPLAPPFCPQCGEPAPAIEGLCGRCRKGEYVFDFARSALFFTHTLREIIHHLKYAERVSLAGSLGDILKGCLDHEPFSGGVVVPVPLHRRRERERGFNQAELIAARLGGPMERGLLRRRKDTPSQTGLSRSERKRNLAGAFEVRGSVAGTVILVDDVYTTGSTVNEIARTLKRAGAQRVEVLTVARVSNEFYRAAETDISETV